MCAMSQDLPTPALPVKKTCASVPLHVSIACAAKRLAQTQRRRQQAQVCPHTPAQRAQPSACAQAQEGAHVFAGQHQVTNARLLLGERACARWSIVNLLPLVAARAEAALARTHAIRVSHDVRVAHVSV